MRIIIIVFLIQELLAHYFILLYSFQLYELYDNLPYNVK